MKNFKKNSKGYTIAELLAVVSILVIISGIIIGILYSTLRGSTKTKITTEVSQNGNYAISLISGMVIDSTDVTKVGDTDLADCTASPSGTKITLKRLDGGLTTLSCQSNNTISSNGASLLNNSQVQVDSCLFSCSQISDDSYAIPIVRVTFKLKDRSSGLAETKASSNFETAISLRNYSP